MRENSYFSTQETSETPENLTQWLSLDHSQCDELYAEGETALAEGQLEIGAQSIRNFIASMKCHLAREEEVLFPAFEEATRMTEGPTSMMRMEHEQILSLLDQMSESLDDKNYDQIFAIGETLNILIQQHNMKEENMLYPMSDEYLENKKSDLFKAMQSITPNGNHETSHLK